MAGQAWSPSAAGGYFSNNSLSAKVRHTAQPQMRIRQFCKPVGAYGKGKGDTVYFDRISNVATAGGTISEQATIPKTSLTVSQGSVVVDEAALAIPYTGKLETLSEFSVDNVITVALKNDMAKCLNSLAATQFLSTYLDYVPTGDSSAPSYSLTVTGTPTETAARDILFYDLKNAVDLLEETYMAVPWDGDNYIMVAPRTTYRKIVDDPNFETWAKYAVPEQLFYGEIGRCYRCRLIVDNQAFTSALGASGYYGEAVLFGADTVVEAIAVNEEIRSQIPQDFGRDKAIAWYWMGGFAQTWAANATAGQVRSIHITSAA